MGDISNGDIMHYIDAVFRRFQTSVQNALNIFSNLKEFRNLQALEFFNY